MTCLHRSYHFLGIGGIGMSALVHILLEKGISVSGFDVNDISHLEKLGVERRTPLPKQSAIVYSSAIKEEDPHLLLAKKEKLPLLHRSELIEHLLKEKKGLLVAGTHGKTSSSALLSWTLYSAGKNPTFAVGGILQNLQKNGGAGTGEHFVVEADESDGSFLNFQGEGAIITNIEKEHLAYWKTEKNLVEGFQKFIASTKNRKLLFWCADDPLLAKLSPEGISYGKQGDLKLLSCDQKGTETYFSASFEGKTYSDIHLPLMGEKLALNALAVFGMALKLGIEESKIRQAFTTFQGVKRRQEKIGVVDRITIYDDYAHHPTEIQTILEGLKKGEKKKRLIALFQPHRFSRTKELFADFKKAFKCADLTIITSIYAAGEKPLPGITGKALSKSVKGSLYIEKEKLLTLLPKILLPGDVLVTMGAGDITKVGREIFRVLS